MKKLYENLKVKLGINSIDSSALIGIVSDYIIDFGENENGSWEKWNSGKLKQIIVKNINFGPCNIPTSPAGTFRTNTATILFPIQFVGKTPGTTITVRRVSGPQCWQSNTGLPSLIDSGQFMMMLSVSSPDVYVGIATISAEGKWK